MITKIAILISMALVLSQNSVAGKPTPVTSVVQPLVEMYQRHPKYCGVYKVVIDDNTYIMTTCGGIILVPEG